MIMILFLFFFASEPITDRLGRDENLKISKMAPTLAREGRESEEEEE